MTSAESQRLLTLLTEKRDVSFITLPAPAPDTAPVPAAEIAKWYKEHQEDFRAPEMVTLEYIEIDGSSLPVPNVADNNALLFFRFAFRQLDGFIQQRFIRNDPLPFDSAGSGQDDLGFGVIDADGQLPGGKPPEDHGMDGPQSGTGQHGQDGFRDHGHIDDYRISLFGPPAL